MTSTETFRNTKAHSALIVMASSPDGISSEIPAGIQELCLLGYAERIANPGADTMFWKGRITELGMAVFCQITNEEDEEAAKRRERAAIESRKRAEAKGLGWLFD